jgi:hypothetical protein
MYHHGFDYAQDEWVSSHTLSLSGAVAYNACICGYECFDSTGSTNESFIFGGEIGGIRE